MPEETTASAVSRISASLTSQPNLFHEFHPMGGVGARAPSGMRADAPERKSATVNAATTSATHTMR